MKKGTNLERCYTLGQHVAGNGLEMSPPGKGTPWRNDCVFEKGVIVMLPEKDSRPYAVFDVQTFLIIEVKEEHLIPLQ